MKCYNELTKYSDLFLYLWLINQFKLKLLDNANN